MSLLPLFEALGRTPAGEYLRASTLAFALTEAVHLIALALIGGIVAVVGLSGAGLFVPRAWASALTVSLRPLFLGATTAVILSGLGLVAAGPYKYYSNPVFWIKLDLLAGALILYAIIDRSLARRMDDRWYWRAGAFMLPVLWLSVAIAGRAIGLI